MSSTASCSVSTHAGRRRPPARSASFSARTSSLDESAAPAHQHHHVAGPHGPVARGRAARPVASIAASVWAMTPRARRARGRRRDAARPAASRARAPARGRARPAATARPGRRGRRGTADARIGAPSSATPALASGRAKTASTACEHGVGRAERDVEIDDAPSCSAAATRWPRNARACAANAAGSARWKLKIDCLASPTAKTVRGSIARAGARRRIPRPAPRPPPIGRGWCPAPRRSGCGRCRHRA